MYEHCAKIDVKIMNNIEMIVLLHPRRTPPHLIKEFIALKANRFYSIGFKAIIGYLLEPPYETNCFNYNRYSLSPERETNLPQSQDECVVNNIQRSEFRECGCNKNWFFDKFDVGNRSCENTNTSCDYNYYRYLYRMKRVVLVLTRPLDLITEQTVEIFIFLRIKNYLILLLFFKLTNSEKKKMFISWL